MTTISLDVCGDVELRHGDRLGWESNVPDAYKVTKTNDRLIISQTQTGGTTVISSGGRTVINSGGNSIVSSVSGGSVVIGGSTGGVWINGKRVDVPDSDTHDSSETPQLVVFVPKMSNVSVKTSGSSELTGSAEIGNLHLETSGSTEVDLTVHGADLRTSGSSEIKLRLLGSKLSSRFSGSTAFELV